MSHLIFCQASFFEDGERKNKKKWILNSMKNVVDGIARMYGKHTEVVLHSLDAEAPEIIKIANGHVTERGEGAPITNLARMKLLEGNDVSDSYVTKTVSGKTLHSITTIVRNPKNKPIGLLCINVDMDVPMQDFLRSKKYGFYF